MPEHTERVELPDGAWWEICPVITRGMRKAFRRAGLQILARADGVDLSNPGAFKKVIMANPGALDLDAIDDAYLLYGTMSWSYPEPISLEAIDKLPEKDVAVVLDRMRELYAEVTEEARKN